MFLNQNLELSIGYGSKRIHGLFGGALWMPFRKCCDSYFKDLTLAVEYDATDYKDATSEPHPDGRDQKVPVNFGIKHRLFDAYDLSLSLVRGNKLAFGISTFYNYGTTTGFFPKTNDPRPYYSPINHEPIGCVRTEDILIQDLLYAFCDQGMGVLKAMMVHDTCGTTLRLHVYNLRYREDTCLRMRMDHILAYLTPPNIDRVVVVLESEGFPLQEYHYNTCALHRYACKRMGEYELHVLTPVKEYCPPPCCYTQPLFQCSRELISFHAWPKIRTFFNSSRGKFKYALGATAGVDGFICNSLYYSALLGYNFAHNLRRVGDFDVLNPSQLINVNSDAVNYYRHKGLTAQELFIQKNHNFKCGLFGRASAGHFNERYGGAALQAVYWPVNSRFAIGIDGAILKKRTVGGLGFQSRIRRLVGTTPTSESFIGKQAFLDLYYDWREMNVELKSSTGRFLAKDFGSRCELTKYFPSGLRVKLWFTITDGNDKINGKTYYDKGFEISLPLDFFCTCSSRTRRKYSLAAWLRDVGYRTTTGRDLIDLIADQRQ